MAKNMSRVGRQRQIIDAVFVCNRGGFKPTIYQIAKICGLSVSPRLRQLIFDLNTTGVLPVERVEHRPNVVKKTYTVDMVALRQHDKKHYEAIRKHWPVMFSDEH